MATESWRSLSAEGLGSALLAATVVGSGVMGARLADGNAALALLANTGATAAVLAVLITILAPVSGAHFNPVVTLALARQKGMRWRVVASYIAVQGIGCILGVVLAHVMFELPVIQVSSHARGGTPLFVSEVVATFGLLLVILTPGNERNTAWLVAGWIGAAYWFTASTSFANPAITLARSLTDSFAGIRPADVPPFVLAQGLGALLAVGTSRLLFATATTTESRDTTGASTRCGA